MTKLILSIAAALLLIWSYGAVHAVPVPEKPAPQRRVDKLQRFCNELSMPSERQCPLMSDL
jgi:hypothetical protein